MGKWEYKLNSGVTLRDAIDANSKEETLNALRKCYQEIHEKIPDDYDDDDLDDDIADIDNELDNLENYEDYDMTLDDIEDNINGLLNKFYDYCDAFKIWVGLN